MSNSVIQGESESDSESEKVRKKVCVREIGNEGVSVRQEEGERAGRLGQRERERERERIPAARASAAWSSEPYSYLDSPPRCMVHDVRMRACSTSPSSLSVWVCVCVCVCVCHELETDRRGPAVNCFSMRSVVKTSKAI